MFPVVFDFPTKMSHFRNDAWKGDLELKKNLKKYVGQSDVKDVKQAVAEELDGPGKLLGYRAMQKKIRQQYDLNVPRELVHAVMYDLHPEANE